MVYILGNCPVCGALISKTIDDDIMRIMEEHGKEDAYITVFDCSVCKEKKLSRANIYSKNLGIAEKWKGGTMTLKDLLEVTNVNVVLMNNLSEMAIVNPRYIGVIAEKVLNKTVGSIETRSDMIKVWLEDD